MPRSDVFEVVPNLLPSCIGSLTSQNATGCGVKFGIESIAGSIMVTNIKAVYARHGQSEPANGMGDGLLCWN